MTIWWKMGKYLFMWCENAHYKANLNSYLKECYKEIPKFWIIQNGKWEKIVWNKITYTWYCRALIFTELFSVLTFVPCRFWKYWLKYSAIQLIQHLMTLTAFLHSNAVFQHLSVSANWLHGSFCLISQSRI